GLHIFQFIAPEDLALYAQWQACIEHRAPTEPQAYADQCCRVRGRDFLVPSSAKIHKRHELHILCPAGVANQRDTGFERDNQAIISHQLVLAVAPYAEASSNNNLLERWEWIGGQLDIETKEELDISGAETPAILKLT